MKQWIPAIPATFSSLIGTFLLFCSSPCAAHAIEPYGKYASASDTIPPSIVCPPDTVIYFPKGSCTASYTYQVLAFDGTDTLMVVQESGLPSGAKFPFGTTTNLFIATDSSGNTATCQFTVRVAAQPYTGINCLPDPAYLYLGPQCTTKLNVLDLVAPGYHSCPEKIRAWVHLPPDSGKDSLVFDYSDLGKTYYIAVHDSLLGVECLVTFIAVQDTTPPQLTCVDINVPCVVPVAHLTPTFLRDSLGIAAGFPDIFEGCPGEVSILFTDVHQSYSCDSALLAGRIRRFWTVGDKQGNFSSCVQNINLLRSASEAQAPEDTTVSCESSTAPTALGWPYFQVGTRRYLIGASNACDLELEYTDTELPTCGGAHLLKRLWTVSNGCQAGDPDAEKFVGEQIIEVIDTAGPVVNCLPVRGAVLQEPGCVGTVDLPDWVLSDPCSPILRAMLIWNSDADTLLAALSDYTDNDSTRLDTLAIFGELTDFNTGLLPMKLVAYDECENATVCHFLLDVRDQQPPTALCDSLVVILLDSAGLGSAPVALFDAGSTDSCHTLKFKVRRTSPTTCDTLGHLWDDLLRVCCADLGAEFDATLRVYDAEIPAGPVADTVASGHYAECQVRVQVQNPHPPRCEAPADVTIACADFDATLATYGEAFFSCGTDSVAVVLDTTDFRWSCGSGVLLRIFQVFDEHGDSASCTQKITGEADYRFFVHFPNDLVVFDCNGPDTPTVPSILSEGCDDVVIELYEERIVPSTLVCYVLERTWRVYNRCYDDIEFVVVPNPQPNPSFGHPANLEGPIVSAPTATGLWKASNMTVAPGEPPTDFSTFWLEEGRGYLYTQFIWVVDNDLPSVECTQTSLTFDDVTVGDTSLWVLNNLDLCEAEVELSIAARDECSGADITVSYVLYIDVDGDGTPESVITSQNAPALPSGVILYNNINSPQYASGTPLDFDRRNVPGAEKYRFDTEKHISGDTLYTRVVWKSSNGITPPKLPKGTHRIEWSVSDICGNATLCERTIVVGSSPNLCAPPTEQVAGSVRIESGAGVPNVPIIVSGQTPLQEPINLSLLTDSKGEFSFEVPAGSIYTAHPVFFNDDYLNGVTTLDLVLINRHILALDTLPSPYRIAAGDANGSRSVTTFDVLELRRLILNIYTELPKSPSWWAIPAAYVFPDPLDPFLEVLPTSITAPDSLHFIAIKVGDVNNSVKLSLHAGAIEERHKPVWHWEVEDRFVRKGELIDIALQGESTVAGIQGTLEFPGMEILSVLPTSTFTSSHYHISAGGRRMTFSWGGPFEAATRPVLHIRARALQSGRLRSLITLANTPTPTEAYSEHTLEVLSTRLRFNKTFAADESLTLRNASEEEEYPHALFQASGLALRSQPNPFDQWTQVYVHLPKEAQTTLRVHDATGRLLWERSIYLPEGTHVVRLDAAALSNTKGVLQFSVETPHDRAVHRLLRF